MFLALCLLYFVVFAFSLNDIFATPTSLRKKIYFFLSCAIAIFSFLIYDKIPATDAVNYVYNYDSLSSFADYIKGINRGIHGYEAGFSLVSLFMKIFINNGVFAMSLIAALGVLGITYQISRYTQFWFIALLVYIGHFYGWNGLILLRQTCALVILFSLLKYIPEKKYFRAILLILLATLFHASSLIYLLVFPLYKILQNNKLVFVAIIASFLIGYFEVIPRFIIMISDSIPRGEILENYILNPGKGINWLSYLVMLFVWSVAVYFKQTLCQNNKYVEVSIVYLGLAIICAGLFQQFEIVIRFVMSFNFYAYVVLFPAFIYIFKNNWQNRLMYVSLLGVYLLLFFVRFFYILDKY